MQPHPTPRAHVCTPPPTGTLAHQRRYEPRNYGSVVAGDGSDPLTLPAKRPRKAAAPKAPKLLYPPLPEARQSTNAEFWRAAFLRDLYTLRIATHLVNKAIKSGAGREDADYIATTNYLCMSLTHQHKEVRQSFNYWAEAMGGLAGMPEEGGAA